MATEEKEEQMTLKFTVGKAGLSLGEGNESEDYVVLGGGQVWKRLKYVTDGIVGTWRWGNLVETIFQDELALRGFFGIAPDLNNEGMNEWQDTDAFLDGLVDGRRGQRR